jgi:endoglucanase
MTRTTVPRLAALLWIKLPGESDGLCGGETTDLFSATQARRLTASSPFVAAEDRRLAAAVEVPTTAYDTAEG